MAERCGSCYRPLDTASEDAVGRPDMEAVVCERCDAKYTCVGCQEWVHARREVPAREALEAYQRGDLDAFVATDEGNTCVTCWLQDNARESRWEEEA